MSNNYPLFIGIVYTVFVLQASFTVLRGKLNIICACDASISARRTLLSIPR